MPFGKQPPSFLLNPPVFPRVPPRIQESVPTKLLISLVKISVQVLPCEEIGSLRGASEMHSEFPQEFFFEAAKGVRP